MFKAGAVTHREEDWKLWQTLDGIEPHVAVPSS
jgi:hypothetical protein